MAATTFDSLSLPRLDYASLTGEELVEQLQRYSFAFVTNIPWFTPALEAMMVETRKFFDSPEAERQKVRWNGVLPWQGWQPLYLAEGGLEAKLPAERFEIRLPDPAGYATTEEWTAQFDQWPNDGLRRTWSAYYASMRELASKLVVMIQQTIGLPEADVEAWTTRQHSNLSVNHYLAQAEEPPHALDRNVAHTDIGGITLLWGQNAADGGLQAQHLETGEWVPIHFPPDTLLVQVGDLLHLWSGGRIPKNPHRVVRPTRWPVPERYSVVFFHHPDLRTWVAPGDGAGGETALDHVVARQSEAYRG